MPRGRNLKMIAKRRSSIWRPPRTSSSKTRFTTDKPSPTKLPISTVNRLENDSMSEVSALMTVYNGMPYLPLAVESVLRQSLRNFKFIIVNDGSTDAGVDYLNSLSDCRVQVVHQENQGTGPAANRGLQLCATEFVARIDPDDIAFPERLERQLHCLRSHPEVGLVGTQVAPLGEAGPGRSLALPTRHQEIYRDMRRGHHALSHSSVMIRTAVLGHIGGYWTKPLFDDWDMMIRIGEHSKLANFPEVLHYYRVHRGSLNGSAMYKVRLSIDYACELARRRENKLPEISVAEF